MKKRFEEQDEHVNEGWLIPYADLLTLLLALFIVLFAMSSLDAKKYEELSKAFNTLNAGSGVLAQSGIIESDTSVDNQVNLKRTIENNLTKQLNTLMKIEQTDLEQVKEKIDTFTQNQGLETKIRTSLTEKQLTIMISDNTLYDSGDSAIKPESRAIIIALARILEGTEDYDIMIAGHTDNVPINNSKFDSNWELSQKRALRFMDILLQNSKIDPGRFRAVGFGEFRPKTSNNTSKGKATNRRVEVILVRKFVTNKDL
ncbi:OmpA family protein [Mycolicibacterium fortuitum]|nr:OmpA family protein [Mycolicibacterium fortuitum]